MNLFQDNSIVGKTLSRQLIDTNYKPELSFIKQDTSSQVTGFFIYRARKRVVPEILLVLSWDSEIMLSFGNFTNYKGEIKKRLSFNAADNVMLRTPISWSEVPAFEPWFCQGTSWDIASSWAPATHGRVSDSWFWWISNPGCCRHWGANQWMEVDGTHLSISLHHLCLLNIVKNIVKNRNKKEKCFEDIFILWNNRIEYGLITLNN